MDYSRLLTGALGAVALAAHAQSPTPAPAGGSGPSLKYESAFADYRRFADVEITSWRRANSDAGALGGHKGHVMRDEPSAVTQTPGHSTPTLPAEPKRVPAADPGRAK